MVAVRVVALCLLVLAAPPAANAQPAAHVQRIGYLSFEPPPTPDVPAMGLDSLRQRLRELGYVEGRNLVIEYRWASLDSGRISQLVNELVQLNVIVIVTYSTFAARTAGRVTSTVPIVCAICADLVGAGVVRSLARPGGNVSGFTVIGPDLAAKRLELLKEISAVSRVLALHASASDFPVAVRWRMENERAARVLGLRIDTMRANTIAALEAGFVLAAREPGVGLTFMEEPLYFVHRRAIGEMVARHRVAAVFPFREHVEAGGLLSYGVDISELFSRAAGYVDKILKGAKPGDLPVEQPTKFDLVINMRAAKALGLAIPPGVLLRADHVIE